MNTKVLAIILAAGTAITLSAGAQAGDRSDGGIFCAVIGLSKANQATCTKQLVNATSDYDRNSVQAKWVARSAMVAGPGHFNTPMVSQLLLSEPTTNSQSRVDFVPNRVVNQIYRALNAALTKPEWKTQVAETEKSSLSNTSIDYAN